MERTKTKILGIDHVGIAVSNVEEALRFYTETLGLPADRQPREGDNMRVSFLHPDAAAGALIELVTKKGKRKT